jgi:hypothetical protein
MTQEQMLEVALAINCAERNDGGYFRGQPPWLMILIVTAREYLKDQGFKNPFEPIPTEFTYDR